MKKCEDCFYRKIKHIGRWCLMRKKQKSFRICKHYKEYPDTIEDKRIAMNDPFWSTAIRSAIGLEQGKIALIWTETDCIAFTLYLRHYFPDSCLDKKNIENYRKIFEKERNCEHIRIVYEWAKTIYSIIRKEKIEKYG